jgi:hypothetical protein
MHTFDHEKLDVWGIFDICKQLGMVDEVLFVKGRELLVRIVAMLTKMAQKAE